MSLRSTLIYAEKRRRVITSSVAKLKGGTMKLKKINASIEEKYCCGCGLCNNFVEGYFDKKGYFRPNMSELKNKFDTGCCYCNTLNYSVSEKMWGDFISLYYGYSNDWTIRKAASSGGVLSELACYLLDSHQVDYVVQIRASSDSQIKTQTVYSKTREEVLQNCGSRYSASAVLTNLLKNIQKNKKYAVIGKPCDISVLRNYMSKHPELENTIIYLFTFFCGGTPSYQANQQLLRKMKINEDELASFCYRGNGWPGKTTGVCHNGSSSQMEYEESWGRILGRDLQEVCRFCWDGVGSAADISCGDGWYLENGKPSFKEQEGRNIIFSRTEKGEKLLKEMQAAGKLTLEKEDNLSVLEQIQPGQYMRKAAMYSRLFAMHIMGKPVPKYNLMKLVPYAKMISFKVNFKMFSGTIKRILQGKID